MRGAKAAVAGVLRPASGPFHRQCCEVAMDDHWMGIALEEAGAAEEEGEVPVGAVVVLGGTVVAVGRNRAIGDCDPTAHAEIVALRAASKALSNYRLAGCDLYVTLEPCAMCVGAASQARVRRLVYGCADPRWGALGPRLDLGRPGTFNHDIEIRGGVLEEECRGRIRSFFRSRRRPVG